MTEQTVEITMLQLIHAIGAAIPMLPVDTTIPDYANFISVVATNLGFER